MTYYLFELENDGQVNMLESNNELDVQLNVDKETEKVHLQVATKNKVVWTGRYIPKKTIYDYDVISLRKKLNIPYHISLDKQLLHQSRTHPRYATFFNRNILQLKQIIGKGNDLPVIKEKSWGNGLSFIGNALIKFITDIHVYEVIGLDGTEEEYQQLSNYLTSKQKLSLINETLEWNKFLAYNGKEITVDNKKGKKIYSDMLKGLAGAIYESNDRIENLPQVLDVVKEMIIPNSNFSFITWNKEYRYLITGALFGYAVGIVSMCVLMY